MENRKIFLLLAIAIVAFLIYKGCFTTKEHYEKRVKRVGECRACG